MGWSASIIFRRGSRCHETWTAKRDDNASLPGPLGLTRGNADVDRAKLSFTGIDGARLALADPKFAGKARIVQLFVTWCPDCNDEAAFLRELDQRYRKQGLSIVGLCFELTGDQERDLEQLRRFAQRRQFEYPLLLAGKSEKAEATKSFPLLDRVRAYPTTVFVRANGSVRAVQQGYSGPATSA
jgi:thiol-disulfide isomerase/thioredoxin